MTDKNIALAKGKTERAIIVGGGFAGLLTARVLADHYRDVFIVDKDAFPEKPKERVGTPQAFHPHRFTGRGREITARLFPGYEDDLVALGAASAQNKRVHNENQYGIMAMPFPQKDFKFSRALLEWVLRQRVKNISNVHFFSKHDVIGLVTNAEQTTVRGIEIRDRELEKQKTLIADIVVDTSGRASKLAQWLTGIGYEVPNPDQLKVDLGYSTRRYQVPADLVHLGEKWDTINIVGQPANGTFTGVFSIIENNIAEVVLYRPGGHYPPTNAEEYEREVTQLPNSIIAQILHDLEPITAPRGYRVPEIFRHHYDQMQHWPSGLLILGDAFATYDPIFGQGMTVAAMEVSMLESCLLEQRKDPKPHFEQKVLQKVQDVIKPAWWLNCAADLQWEGVEYVGSKPLQGISFAQKYMDLFLKEATTKRNFELFGMYWGVNTLYAPPSVIFNVSRVSSVLHSSDEGKQLLTELTQEYGKPLEEILDEIVPTFSAEPYEPVGQ